MIERRGVPGRCCVAQGAIGWETGSHVSGICGAIEVGRMTGEASRRRRSVVIVDMALRASHGCMRTRKRIVRIEGVVELSVEPVGRRVTVAALVRQAYLHVRRIVGVRKVGGMAPVAGGRCSLEDIVDVARRTVERGVRPGQRVAGIFQMVKFGIEPDVHGVAAIARRGEAQSHVIEDRS